MDDVKTESPPEPAAAPPRSGKASARAGRTQRLAAALRDNLKRRKATRGAPRPVRPSN